MRKVILFLFVLLSFNTYANDGDFYIEFTIGEDYIEYDSSSSKYIYYFYNADLGEFDQVDFFDKDIIFLENGYGYVSVKINEKSTYSICIVTGSRHFLSYSDQYTSLNSLISYGIKPYTYYYTKEKYKLKDKDLRFFDEKLLPDYNASLFTKGIKNINSSSFFTEKIGSKTTEYSSIGLNKRYIGLFFSGNWNWELPPWVEGVDGSGIGEWLEVLFDEPRDEIIILNGYVDFKKPNLYKDNNRVKKFKVIPTDGGEHFEKIIALEDIVKFQGFDLPRECKSVKLEILEVFKGNKWDDTAITGIFAEGFE